MIKLECPQIDQKEIIDACVSNMNTNERKRRIIASATEIIQKSILYNEQATEAKLYTNSVHNKLCSGATEDDMKALYEQKFVSGNGRIYYEKLRLMAPHEQCPYCGQGIVKTLDHYLPKSKYPVFSVTPYNLVPACSDCNREKLSSIYLSCEEQVLHPYYDDFSDVTWVCAELVPGDEISFKYSVDDSVFIDTIRAKRAEKHFEVFKLKTMYGALAASHYIGYENGIKRVYKKGGKRATLERIDEDIEDEELVRKNTWKVAMYKAIKDSEWYWDTYVKTIM